MCSLWVCWWENWIEFQMHFKSPLNCKVGSYWWPHRVSWLIECCLKFWCKTCWRRILEVEISSVVCLQRIENNWRTGRHALQRIHCRSETSKGVYCLQYDDNKIISGLRDNTIKVQLVVVIAIDLIYIVQLHLDTNNILTAMDIVIQYICIMCVYTYAHHEYSYS